MTTKPVVARVGHPVSEVARMLCRGGYRRLPVVRDSFIAGTVTPRDIISYLRGDKRMDALKKDRNEIEKAMNRFVTDIRPEADIFEAVQLMKRKGISMLPVVDSYQLVGILAQRDILDAM